MQFVLQQIRLGFHLMQVDPYLQGEIQRTVRLALEATGIAMLWGAVPAYLIGISKGRLSHWCMMIANAGLGLPSVAVGVYLVFILPAYTPFGGEWYETMNGMIAGQTVLAFPIVLALSATAIRDLPDGMIDQARAYGASGWRLALFAYREAKIGVLSAVILALGSAVGEVGAVTILGGNQVASTSTVSSQILNLIPGSNFPQDETFMGPPGEVEHAIVVLALMGILAAFLTIVQQWGARQRRQRTGTRVLAPRTVRVAGPGVGRYTDPGRAAPRQTRW